MTTETPTPASPLQRFFVNRPDLAYILPMAVFLLFTLVGGNWQSLFPASYIAKTVLAALLLVLLWRHYTKIRWTHLHWGVIVGVLGVVQWVGMEKLLVWYGPSWTRMSVNWDELFNPFAHFDSPATAWTFIAIRWAGASLVVPVMEELFWRDFAWRTIIAPNDFKLAEVGEYDHTAFFVVPAIFAAVHIQWLTAVVWGLMIAVLLVKTRSLGACIVAHGVTNFLLGAYVLYTGDWYFW